jgi:hypothetical protein
MEIEHLIRSTALAVGLMEIENLIRYTEPAVGLKPSAMECEARLRGL